MTSPFLELCGVSKSFQGIHALQDVTFSMSCGEVVGLVGDNGAGKSTLINIICGNYPPSAGHVKVQGAIQRFTAPKDARKAGIEVVYQDLALSPNLNAIENIFLGHETRLFPSLWSPLRFSKMRHRSEELLKRLQSDSNISEKISSFSGGQRQAVAIARALRDDARMIIMDEPLAAISIRQVQEVLNLITSLKDDGQGVLLVSHRLDDIFKVCDRVVVLRRGEKISDTSIDALTPSDLTALITGAQ